MAIFRRLLYVISMPIALILALISPFFKIRLIGLQSFRIGHYALTTELMLCALDMNQEEKKKRTLFYNMSKPCNLQLYKMWKRVIPIFSFSRLAIQVDQILSIILGEPYRDDKIKKIYESCETGTIDKSGFLKKINKPRLFFTKKEIHRAKNILLQLGISDKSKFICLIVRDSAYLNAHDPKTNWSYHDHRNADVMTYEKAARYLADKGYTVLRMGKYVNQPFNVDHPNIIDYANHPLRSDFMDIYLSAHCEFCISTCTGLDCVSQIFRKPVLLTNISPVFGETLMWYPCTVFIPKFLKNKDTNQILTLSEVAKTCHEFASKNALNEFSKKNLILVENSEDEILAVVIEMEARISGQWHESEHEPLLQTQYWAHYKKHCPVPVDHIYVKIGDNLLETNRFLLN